MSSSSRFVSGGAIDAATGETVDRPPGSGGATSPRTGMTGIKAKMRTGSEGAGTRHAEWEVVQKELEAERRQREEARRAAAEGGEKSLYEVLQANKAAKQAAFEEAAKFKNQFRALDDDEVEFLDDIRSSVRADEERLRRETREGLDAFRAAQREREREAALAGGDEGDGATDGADGAEGWAVAAGRKRKREKERVIKGVKRRASDLDRGGGDGRGGEEKEKDEKQNEENDVVQRRDTEGDQAVAQRLDKNAPASQAQRSHQGTKPKLGLVDYGSDDDDDD